MRIRRKKAGSSGFTPYRTPRWRPYITLVFVTLFGILLLAAGVASCDAKQPVGGGRTTTGTVIRVDTGQNCHRGSCTTYYSPIIRFTVSGRDFTFEGPSSSVDNTGDRVQVSYDPASPAHAHDVSAGGVGWDYAGVGVGIFFILFGLVCAWLLAS